MGEAKGAREATKQLGQQVHTLDSAVSESERKMGSLHQALRLLETRQQQQNSMVGAAREEDILSRKQIQAREKQCWHVVSLAK